MKKIKPDYGYDVATVVDPLGRVKCELWKWIQLPCTCFRQTTFEINGNVLEKDHHTSFCYDYKKWRKRDRRI